jgi:hypothetical protein
MSPRQPLDGIELVLIDGNNLLHRQSGGIGAAAVRGLLVDLQRKLPPGVRAVVVLDGHPAPGTPLQQRISSSLEVRHSAGRSADDAMVAEVAAQPWASRGRTIIVTDDRALADRSRSAGALTRRLDWLTALPTAPTVAAKPGTTIGTGGPRSPRPRRH